MSDLEALMWNLDKDPRLSSTVGNLTILDRAPDFERLRTRMQRSAEMIPRFHQRVVPAFGRMAPPRWQADPDFDLDHHLRWISLGRRNSNSALHGTVMRIFGDPFDRTRPLWEFVVIEGLREGRAAMLQRIHHTLMDGEGALRISEQFIDLERDAPLPDRVPTSTDPPPDTTLWSTVADTTEHVISRGMGIAGRAGGQFVEGVRHPVDSVRHGADMGHSAMKQVRVTNEPLSPIWTQRSLRRSFNNLDVPLTTAKKAAANLGGSVNDVFVAGAAAAAGSYHRELGVDVDALRMAMPISQRTDGSAGGNMFSLSQTEVPTGGIDPLEHFALIHDELRATRADPATSALEGVSGIVNLLPTSVLVRSAFRIASTVDFTTSNLRAAPFDCYMGGALIEANYPIGPLAGTAFNLTTMSYRGILWMGLVTDDEAIAEPKRLARCLKQSFADLFDAAGAE
jgi:diacylglycerol O-acyltransferase